MRTADAATTAFGAIVGICAALIICVIALIILFIVFCNTKMKNDNNIRKRVFANDAFDEVKTVQEARLYYAFIVLNIATINTSLNLYLMTSGEGRIGPTTESNCLIAPPSRYSNSI